MAGRPDTYTIQEIRSDQTWPGNDTEMRTLEVVLQGEQQTRKAMKPSNDAVWQTFPGGAPSVGGNIVGWLNGTDKIGLAQDQGGNGNGASAQTQMPMAQPQAASQSAPAPTGQAIAQPRQPDARDIQAKHTASLAAACQIYELGRTENVIPKAETSEQFTAKLFEIAEKVKASYPQPGEGDASPGLAAQTEALQQQAQPTQEQVAAAAPVDPTAPSF